VLVNASYVLEGSAAPARAGGGPRGAGSTEEMIPLSEVQDRRAATELAALEAEHQRLRGAQTARCATRSTSSSLADRSGSVPEREGDRHRGGLIR